MTYENAYPEFYNRLKKYAEDEEYNINKERTLNRNMTFAFNNIGGLGEELVMYLYPNSIGSASKGGCAFDIITDYDENFKTTRAIEVKTVCLNGSKECKLCKLKAPTFQKVCLKCKNSDFTYKMDSRAGIQAKEHVVHKDILAYYIIFVLNFNETTNQLSFTGYKIDSNNEYFTKYIENQYKNGKGNTCNFLPHSYDFYLSGPCKIMDLSICFETKKVNTNYFDLNNDVIENIPTKIFRKDELNHYNIKETENITYESLKDLLILRKKSLGKERGEVKRK